MSIQRKSRHLLPPAHPPFLFEWVLDLLFLVLAVLVAEAALVAEVTVFLGPAIVSAIVSATVSGCHRILELLFHYLVALSLAALVAEARGRSERVQAAPLVWVQAWPLVWCPVQCSRCENPHSGQRRCDELSPPECA